MKLIILFIFCLIKFSFQGSDKYGHEQIDMVINHKLTREEFSLCIKFLNSTHQMGCSGEYKGNKGALIVLSSDKEMDWLRQPGHNKDYIILMDFTFFHSHIIEELIDMEHIKGILVDLTTNMTPGYFSPDLSSPNYEQSIYSENFDWNSVGNGLFQMDIPFPIALLHDNDTVKLMRDCYNTHNKRLTSGCYEACPLCAVQIDAAMQADTSSLVCLRRQYLLNDIFNTIGYCSPIAGYSYFASPSPWVKFETDSVTLIIARLDSLSLFEMSSPGAVSAVTGFVGLYAVASIFVRIRKTFEAELEKKPVVFGLFNGESFNYIGSTRFVLDIVNNTHDFLNLDQIGAIVEMSHLGRPEIYRTGGGHGNGSSTSDATKRNSNATSNNPHPVPPSSSSPTNRSTYYGPDPEDDEDDFEEDDDDLEDFSDVAYVHADLTYPKESTDKVKAFLDKFLTKQQQQDPSVELRHSTVNQLPPSSIHSFLRRKPSIAGIVVSNHDKSYDNVFHNSFLDTPEQHNWYDPTWSEEVKYKKATGNVRYIASVATSVACAVLREVTGKDDCSDVKPASTRLIANLLYCFTQDSDCELFNAIVNKEFAVSLSKPDMKSRFKNRFVGYDDYRDQPETKIHHYLLAHLLGNKVDMKKCEDDSSSPPNKKGKEKGSPPGPRYTKTNGFNSTYTGKREPMCTECYQFSVRSSSPLLKAVEETDADLKVNLDFPTWVVSHQDEKHQRIKVFLMPCMAQELKTCLLGIGVIMFFIPTVMFCKKKLLII